MSDPSTEADLTPVERGMGAWRRVIDWFEKHPWVIAGAVPCVVVVKVLRVAEGDMGTAQVIFGAQGVASLAALVLVSAIPSAILSALLCGFILLGVILGDGTWKKYWVPVAILLISTFSFTGLLTSIEIAGSIASLGGCMGLIIWVCRGVRRKRRRPAAHANREPREEVGSYGWPEFAWMATVFGLAGVVFSASIIGPMWMPAESVVIRGEAVAGYVLSDDGNRAVVLLEADRTAVSYRSEELEERQRCQLTRRQIQEQYSSALVALGSWWPHDPSSEYPECPS